MNNMDYDDKDEEGDEQEESTSLEGKGWDILAGGKQNPFEMGGEDPFDLKSSDNPNPYTDDDEANWILTSGAPTPPQEEMPPEAYLDRGHGAYEGTPGQPAEAAPRDLSPDDLGALTSSELGAYDAGPITAPPERFAEMGAEATGPADVPSSDSIPGMSFGVTVTPVGPEGEPPVMAPPSDLPPISPMPEAYPTSSGVPSPGTGLSPGVDVTPLGPDGEPLAPPAGPSIPPHAHGPDETSPIPSTQPPGGAIPMPPDFGSPPGGPTQPSAGGPVVPTAPLPAIPDVPPWDLPRQPQGLMPADAFIRDPFFSPPRISVAGEEPLPKDDLAAMLITSDRVNALWDEINETYDLVIDDVRGHFETTQQAIENLKQARALLLSGPENFDNAERLVIEVKARLRLEEKVRQWSRTMGTWLGVYLVVWLLLLSAASFLTKRMDIITEPFVPQLLAATWLPSLFGGLGGVIGALWILVKHIAIKRDFDPIHTPWYVVNPFLGVAMGVVTYFVLVGGGNTLLKAVGSNIELSGANSSPVLLLICIIIGFNQNVLWALIDRVVDTIFPRPIEEETATVDMPIVAEGTTKTGPQG